MDGNRLLPAEILHIFPVFVPLFPREPGDPEQETF